MHNKVYEIIKENLLKKLEEAKEEKSLHWIKPWSCGCGLAKSYFSAEHEHYNGINLLLNPPSEYLTFKAIQDLQKKDPTIKLRKGSKSHPIYFYNFCDKKDKDGNVMTDEDGNAIKVPFIKFYKVFCIEDIDNLESRMPVHDYEHELNDNMKKADMFIQKYCELNNIDLEIKKGSASAYFVPATNSITLPDKSQYKIVEEYYSTTFHEICHAIDKKLQLIGDDPTEKSNKYVDLAYIRYKQIERENSLLRELMAMVEQLIQPIKDIVHY